MSMNLLLETSPVPWSYLMSPSAMESAKGGTLTVCSDHKLDVVWIPCQVRSLGINNSG